MMPISALVLSTLQAASFANAGDAPPATQLQQLAFFQGQWTCQSDSDPNQKIETQLSVTLDLQKSWYIQKWSEGDTDESDFSEGHAYATFETIQNKFVEVTFSAHSGLSYATSEGWVGDTFTFTGGANNYKGAQVHVEKSFTKVDDNTFNLAISVATLDKGEASHDLWQKVGSKTCKRAS